MDRHEDALADTSESLELSPHSFKALRTRARTNLHLERFDAAVADFKSAIEQAQMEFSSTGGGDTEIRSLKSELKKAEAALKRSKTKDYYKILGVSRDCTEVDIKKAYRRESLKHHPDKVRFCAHCFLFFYAYALFKGGDEEKFKLVVEAHTVLSDARRRERYDLGEDEDGLNDGGPGGFGGGSPFGGMAPGDIEELFSHFGGGGFGGGGFGGAGFGGGHGGHGGRRGHSHGFNF